MSNLSEGYKKYVKFTNISGKEWKAHCPFHKDDNPSMNVKMEEDLWHCHSCGAGGKGVETLAERLGVKSNTIPAEEIEKWYKELKNTPKAVEWLLTVRGWTEEVIDKHKIGFDSTRFTIPIADKDGQYRNVRRYRPGDKNKVISYGKGYGKSRLFPISELDGNPILLMEGEPDTLAALSMGFNAITQTTGANTWKIDQAYDLSKKDVIIVYDNDKAGKEGAKKVSLTLMNKAKSLRIVTLPVEETEDFTDFVVKYKHTKKDFIKLVNEAPNLVEKRKLVEEDPSDVIKTDLFSSSKGSFYGKTVQLPVLIVGKDLSPYLIPKEIVATCSAGMKKCQACPLSGGQVKAEFDIYHPDILNMVDQKRFVIDKIITFKLGALCAAYQWKATSSVNVEDVSVVADVEYSVPDPDKEGEYVIRAVYYIGHGIKTNMTYLLTGTVYPTPKTQHATILVSKADPKQDSIASFRLTNEISKSLIIFRRSDE